MASLLEAEWIRAYRVGRRAGLKHEDAEEVGQEYCIGLLKAKAAYDASRPVKSYVNTILTRAIAARRRSLKRLWGNLAASGPEDAEPGASEPAATDETPLEAALAGELLERSRQAIEKLPEHQREVVELHLEGLTDEQIAEVLGISIGNVQVRLHRARQRLRSLMLSMF
jgi:RNA polymerase sigma-70 factor (ECF subfamily)